MTNEPKTYTLKVTLPDTTGEEADRLAGLWEHELANIGYQDTFVEYAEYAPTTAWALAVDSAETYDVELYATEYLAQEELRRLFVDNPYLDVPEGELDNWGERATFEEIHEWLQDCGIENNITEVTL